MPALSDSKSRALSISKLTECDPSELSGLLRQLSRERVSHSWSGLDPLTCPTALHDLENERRPTEIFAYHFREGGAAHWRLVGVAALATKISHSFPFAGFPVMARSYILAEFRGRGLYWDLFEHRLRLCADRLGIDLMAIHLGSGSAAVQRAVAEPRAGLPRFFQIGIERLMVDGAPHEVAAYLSFSEAFLRRLAVDSTFVAQPDRDPLPVARALSQIRAWTERPSEDSAGLGGTSWAELRAMCSHIRLVRMGGEATAAS